MRISCIILAAASLLLATLVWGADFQKGLDAYSSADYETALAEWQPLAEAGDIGSQFGLGQMYGNGFGVTMDDAAAIKWYGLAAGQGHAAAQCNLAVMHQNGWGLPQNDVAAMRLFGLAADQGVTEPEHRLAMVELAVSSNPKFCASDIEVRRPGLTYTVDTLQQLRCEYDSDTELFLILGMDSLNQLERWRSPERLFDLCTVVGISRPGQDDIDLDKLESIAEGASGKVILMPGPSVGISGAEIRDRAAHGRSIRYRVPEAVETYILDHGLYTRR